jgi:NADP-dependent 3-hydroxy acid dehydrogenase YdfG
VETPFWEGRPDDQPPPGPLLTPDDVARSVAWAIDQPPGVDVNTIVIRPLGQTI